MTILIPIIFLIIQLLILATLWGILMALKNGFNQVIAGLQSIERATVVEPAPTTRTEMRASESE